MLDSICCLSYGSGVSASSEWSEREGGCRRSIVRWSRRFQLLHAAPDFKLHSTEVRKRMTISELSVTLLITI